jgi:RNA polymerase sigma factor (TIGR02999 family)
LVKIPGGAAENQSQFTSAGRRELTSAHFFLNHLPKILGFLNKTARPSGDLFVNHSRPTEPQLITDLLREFQRGNAAVESELFAAVYADLRARARQCMASERASHTLQPTALVHEAFLRIFHGAGIEWQNRTHFLAIAARQMRRVLIDHGREHRAAKRGFGWKVSLTDHDAPNPEIGVDPEALEALLDRLQRADPAACQVVELKFFSGLTDQEVARALGVSHSTVRRHWKFARAWLRERLDVASPKH